MGLSDVADLTQIVFYVIAGLAVLVGGAAAFWRFVLQQPYGVAWKVDFAPTCQVRLLKDGRYLYMLRLQVHNLSVSLHKCTTVWPFMFFPDEPGYDWLQPVKSMAPNTNRRLGDPSEWRRVVPAGAGMEAIITREHADLFHVVSVKIAIQSEPRKWLGVKAFRKSVMYIAGLEVPVDAEDLRLYETGTG